MQKYWKSNLELNLETLSQSCKHYVTVYYCLRLCSTVTASRSRGSVCLRPVLESHGRYWTTLNSLCPRVELIAGVDSCAWSTWSPLKYTPLTVPTWGVEEVHGWPSHPVSVPSAAWVCVTLDTTDCNVSKSVSTVDVLAMSALPSLLAGTVGRHSEWQAGQCVRCQCW